MSIEILCFALGVFVGIGIALGVFACLVYRGQKKYRIHIKSKLVWEEYYSQTIGQLVKNIVN